MITEPSVKLDQLKVATEFYTQHYPEVYVIHCGDCGDALGIEVMGAVEGLQANELGLTVITLGDKLASSRARHDVDENGQRIMGYSCICGNNTILSPLEEEAYTNTTGKTAAFDLFPHEFPAFKAELDRLQSQRTKRPEETFRRERIK